MSSQIGVGGWGGVGSSCVRGSDGVCKLRLEREGSC